MTDQGQGWHDDSQEHAEAAKGNSPANGSSDSSSGSSGQGWHGDPQGHSDAAKDANGDGLVDKLKGAVTDSDGSDSQSGQGQGWHGDSEGHSEAAKEGSN